MFVGVLVLVLMLIPSPVRRVGFGGVVGRSVGWITGVVGWVTSTAIFFFGGILTINRCYYEYFDEFLYFLLMGFYCINKPFVLYTYTLLLLIDR